MALVPPFARRLFRKLKSLRAGRIDRLDFRASHVEQVRALKRSVGAEQAMKLAVGGEFEAMGMLELETLKHFGLKEDFYVVDVGCGSGRLALPLSRYLTGRYLGTDVVPDLVTYARQLVARPDWQFEVTQGLDIPAGDGVADMVCFFSVFTHLLHEQSYVYLQEARRVLKPGGKIIFSFLEFDNPAHWGVFESSMRAPGVGSSPLNMFISKDSIRIWAGHLGLTIQCIEDGVNHYVPLSKPITFQEGVVMEKMGTIGQSVCVLQK